MKFATLFRSGLARFCAVLALAVVCGLSASAQTFLHEGLVWKNNKGKLELQKPSVAPENGEAPGDYTGDYVIPTEITYNGTTYTVSTLKAAFKATNVHSVVMPAGVGMSRGCFQDCPELVAITLPSDIAKLEGNTFQNCVKLQSITIPGTVAELTTSLFNNCPALEEMIIEDGAKPLVLQAASFGTSYIKRLTVNRALSEGSYTAMDQKPWRGNANIEEVTIGGSCLELPSNYFENATNLTKVTFTNDFTTINLSTFAGSGLTEIAIPASMTSLPGSAFQSCSSLAKVTLPETLTTISSLAFANCALTEVAIPASVSSIGNMAFANNQLTGALTLSEGLTSLGDQVFAGNAALTEVNLPASLKSMGNGVFMNCSAVAKFTVAEGNPTFQSVDNNYIVTDEGTTVYALAPACALTSFSGDFTAVKSYAFYGATNLQEVSLPACADFGDYAFAFSGIKALTVRGTIGRYVASSCPALETITVEATQVPVGVAFNCTALTTANLNAHVTVVGADAFNGCSALKSLNLGDILSILERDCFAGSGIEALQVAAFYPAAMTEGVFTEAMNITVTVPNSLVEAYKAATGWNFLNIVGDENLAVGGEDLGMPAGLYYAGEDNNLHCVYADGQTDDYEIGLQHMFQLTEFSNRIYGASAGKKFWWSASAATEGDGKLFYISKVGGNIFQATILDNAGNNAYMDPTGLYVYNGILYVNDRNVCIRKISADAIALPQDYPSWMENNWMPFYGQEWVYGCIKNGFDITEEEVNGELRPRYWVGMKYNGNGLFNFTDANIGKSSAEVGPRDGANAFLTSMNLIATSYVLDKKYGFIYMYIEFAGNQENLVKGGLYRFPIEMLEQNPNPSPATFMEDLAVELVDGAPVKYEGNATNEHVGISQLAIDADGEYLYWCYRAPSAEEAAENEAQDWATSQKGRYYWAETFDEANPLHQSGIKRIKLGNDLPAVEMVAPGVNGYGVVAVNYEGSVKPDGVESVHNEIVSAITLNGTEVLASEALTLMVYNVAGQAVDCATLAAGQTYSISHLAAGTYVLEARTAAARQALLIQK